MRWVDIEKEVPDIGEVVLICDSFYGYYVCTYLGCSENGKHRFQETIEDYSEWTDVLWWCRIDNPKPLGVKNDDLKPCPLCGCEDIREKRNHRGVRLYCSNCKIGFIDVNLKRHWSYEEQMNALQTYERVWNDRLGVDRKMDF